MPRMRDLLWMAVGAALLAVLMVAMLRVDGDEPRVDEAATSRAQRLELVHQMRLGLTASSEAEKSAVMAATDDQAQAYTLESHTFAAAVEKARTALGDLLAKSGTDAERELFDKFSTTFADFRRANDEVLQLAVQNTNVEASALAFGGAAAALKEMDAALMRLVASTARTPNAARVTELALGTSAAGWRLQAMLFPHIAEGSYEKMDQMEQELYQEQDKARDNLAALAGIAALTDNPDLAAAAAQWARYTEIKPRIIALSRANTNVRSLRLSTTRKQELARECQAGLTALERAIKEEKPPAPVRG